MQDQRPAEGTPRALVVIKLAHTLVWAVFAACILAIPVAAWRGAYGATAILTAVVACEVLVLVFNSWSCPLTSVAARYTPDRGDNFDIYLPEWLARHNKLIFGTLYVGGVAYALLRWRGAAG